VKPARASELDTIVAPATAMARSAIAVVRLSGTDALAIARTVAPRLPDRPAPRKAHLVDLRDGGGNVFDRALITFFPGPASYTAEDVIEISLHGNPVLVRKLLRAAQTAGARPAQPGEFSRRAFMHEKLSLIEAESVGELIDAKTEAAARGALARLSGAGNGVLAEIRESLLAAHALWTAAIDFPEQAGDEDPSEIAPHLASAHDALARLARGSELACRIAAGLRVAIVGPPNAGKSTIFNGLLGFDRAIVTAAPGTTRDTLEADVEIAGLPVRLVDTAGIRSTEDPAESEGVARSLGESRKADLAVYVHDASRPWTASASGAWKAVPSTKKMLIFNKTDLACAPEGEHGFSISAIRDDAPALLRAEIGRRLASDFPLEAAGEAVSIRQRDLLLRARDAVASAEQALARGERAEIAVSSVEGALAILSELVGESTTEDVLDRLFSTFCVGK
jgi:tRNA modification GTPase